jgi:hypothetical protein
MSSLVVCSSEAASTLAYQIINQSNLKITCGENLYNWVFQKILYFPSQNRVIRKVREKQHQNPEFDHTQGKIF